MLLAFVSSWSHSTYFTLIYLYKLYHLFQDFRFVQVDIVLLFQHIFHYKLDSQLIVVWILAEAKHSDWLWSPQIIYMCVGVYVYVCVLCVFICVCVYLYMCVCMYVYMYVVMYYVYIFILFAAWSITNSNTTCLERSS